ncbi:hypothetical protein XI06_15335, partial [Bradyrhizobium sp. CCBAU 11434]|nr:hypothetical protein [Bradyrhizobium sp. CCBAU 11434]
MNLSISTKGQIELQPYAYRCLPCRRVDTIAIPAETDRALLTWPGNQFSMGPFTSMTFTVEIYGTALDGSEWLIHRTTVWA